MEATSLTGQGAVLRVTATAHARGTNVEITCA